MGMSFESYRNPPHKLTVGEKYVDAGGRLWRVIDSRHLAQEGNDREVPFLYRAANEAWGPLRRAPEPSIDRVEFLRKITEIAERDDGARVLAATLEDVLHELWSIENDMRHPSVDRHVDNVLETIEHSLFEHFHRPTGQERHEQ